MKKFEIIIIAVMLAGVGWICRGLIPRAPEGIHGKVKTAVVTKRYFSDAGTNFTILKKTVVIQEPDRLAAIEQSLKSVPNNFSYNSGEEFPRYRMRVKYLDGRRQSFYFGKTEFGATGRTPETLIQELEKTGL